VQIPDVLADPEYSFGTQPIVGFRALLGVPVVLDGELNGVMSIGRQVPGPFVEDEVELVKTFADQAAIAIANARLLDSVERQRTELSRFISPQVAALVSSEEGKWMLAGHRAHISVAFCDLRGFTAFAETAAPEELLDVLGSYHAMIGELIREHEMLARRSAEFHLVNAELDGDVAGWAGLAKLAPTRSSWLATHFNPQVNPDGGESVTGCRSASKR
jgi:GAF domain-containing protein